MKTIYHNRNIEYYIIKYTLVYVLFITLLLLFVVNKSWALSFLLGGIVNIFCFKKTVKAVDRVIGNNGYNARRILVSSNVTKLSIYTICLILAGLSYKYHNDYPIHLEIIPMAIAFLSVKLVIYFKQFVLDRIFDIKELEDQFPIKKGRYKKEEGVENGKDC